MTDDAEVAGTDEGTESQAPDAADGVEAELDEAQDSDEDGAQDPDEDDADGPFDLEGELDVIVLEAVEQYGGAVEALTAYNAARENMAAEAQVHASQLPEDRREFVLRRKLEIAAAQDHKTRHDTAAVEARRSRRTAEVAAADGHARRGARIQRDERLAEARRDERKPQHGRSGEAEATQAAHDAAARADAAAAEDAEAKRLAAEEEAEGERSAQLEGDPQADKVVTNKMAIPENLDGLKLAELKAIADSHGLTVERTDTKPGAPRVSDYVAALSV